MENRQNIHSVLNTKVDLSTSIHTDVGKSSLKIRAFTFQDVFALEFKPNAANKCTIYSNLFIVSIKRIKKIKLQNLVKLSNCKQPNIDWRQIDKKW